MKKLMLAILACAATVAVDAAQCAGVTQQGVRCKRESAEGSKYCIGHADQAKKDAKAEPKAKDAKTAPKATDAKAATKDKTAPKGKVEPKEKDDGTCWAVTKDGKRCKLKKDGDKDYCKKHAANRKPSKPVTQCRAMTYEGTQCIRKPEEGKRYCKQHMGK